MSEPMRSPAAAAVSPPTTDASRYPTAVGHSPSRPSTRSDAITAESVVNEPRTPGPMPAFSHIGPGVLGSFTTLSAVTASLLVLGREGEWPTAVGYLLASVVGGLAAAAAGLRIGSLIAHRPMPSEVTDAGETL